MFTSILGRVAQTLNKLALDGLSVALLKLGALDEKTILNVRLANPELDPNDRRLVLGYLEGKTPSAKLFERFAQVSYWRDKAYEGWGNEDTSKEAKRTDAYTWVIKALGLYKTAASVYAQVAFQVYLSPEEQKELKSTKPEELFRKAYQIEQEMGNLIEGSKLKRLVDLNWRAWQSACEAAGIDYDDLKAKEREGWHPYYVHEIDKITETPEITDDIAVRPSFIQQLKSYFEKYAIYLATDEFEPEEGLLLQTISNNLDTVYLDFGLWPETRDTLKKNIPIPQRLSTPVTMKDLAEKAISMQPEDLPQEIVEALKKMEKWDYVKDRITHITFVPKFVDAAQRLSASVSLGGIGFPILERVILEATANGQPIPAWKLAGILVHETTHVEDFYKQFGRQEIHQLPYEVHAREQELEALEKYSKSYDLQTVHNEIALLKLIIGAANVIKDNPKAEEVYPAEMILDWYFWKQLPEIMIDEKIDMKKIDKEIDMEIELEKREVFFDCLIQHLFGTEPCDLPEVSFRI